MVKSGCAIEQVNFYGDVIQAVRVGEKVWVVVKRVCEALGLAFAAQSVKLREKPWACVSLIETHDTSGRVQEAFCLSLDSLPMWLAGIEPSRVKSEARDKLIVYQRECKRVLADHFFGKRSATSDGMVHVSMIGQVIEPLLERQNQNFLLLLDRHAEREARIEQRLTSLESGRSSGTISPQTLSRIKALVRKIAEKEVLLGRWPKGLRSAQRDIYRELGDRTGWGGKQQNWCDLPAHCESVVIVYLSRRLVDAERHTDALAVRQLDFFKKEETPLFSKKPPAQRDEN